MYQILRHLSPAQELLGYDKNNKVILVASTKDIVWKDTVSKDMKIKLGWEISIDKVFYEAKEV